MSKVEVLCPNGHRVHVKITPNTKLLSVLEEACTKQHFQPPEDYELRHGRKVLDLTLTVRFSGLTNLAKLELVKAAQSRPTVGSVTIALQLDHGGRLQSDFPSSSSLWDVLMSWESKSDSEVQLTQIRSDARLQPVCIYMREEVIGEVALKETTLKKLGLVSGRAVIRFLHRAIDDSTMEDINTTFTNEKKRRVTSDDKPTTPSLSQQTPNTSEEQQSTNLTRHVTPQPHAMETDTTKQQTVRSDQVEPMDVDSTTALDSLMQTETRKDSEKSRVRGSAIKSKPISETLPTEDRTQACDREPVSYKAEKMCPSVASDADEPPDEFFELTDDDIRKLWNDLQKNLISERSAPLMTSAMREAAQEEKFNKYSRVILRFHFPERVFLQALFRPGETVAAVYNFVKDNLQEPANSFYLYTTPPRCVLKDLSSTLVKVSLLSQARLAPMSVVYFGSEVKKDFYLKPELLQSITSQRDANSVITNYMSSTISSTRESENYTPMEIPRQVTSSNQNTAPKTETKSGKAPKWFQMGKK